MEGLDTTAGLGMCSNVLLDENANLSSAQKELLLWHWKLGISIQRVQELMRVVEMREPDGAITTMDRVIASKIKSAAYCPMPLCQSCQLSCTKQQKSKVIRSKLFQPKRALCKAKNTRAVILCQWISMSSEHRVGCIVVIAENQM